MKGRKGQGRRGRKNEGREGLRSKRKREWDKGREKRLGEREGRQERRLK